MAAASWLAAPPNEKSRLFIFPARTRSGLVGGLYPSA